MVVEFNNKIARACLMLLMGLILSCSDNTAIAVFDPEGEEPNELVIEIEWGEENGKFGLSKSVWEPSFEYFYVRGNDQFFVDQLKKEVIYYKGGKYIKSFDFYHMIHDRLLGLIVIDDIVYWFFDGGGAQGVRVNDGESVYFKNFPFVPSQNNTYVYLYDDVMVVTEDLFGSDETIARLCLKKMLVEVACPKELASHAGHFSDFQYIFPNYYSYTAKIENHKISGLGVYLFNKQINKVEAAVVLGNRDLSYLMTGDKLVTKDGVYFVKHTGKTAQVWFKPWWKVRGKTQ